MLARFVVCIESVRAVVKVDGVSHSLADRGAEVDVGRRESWRRSRDMASNIYRIIPRIQLSVFPALHVLLLAVSLRSIYIINAP